MGDFTWKILANGQLPAADADIYVVPAGMEVAIRKLTLTNIHNSAVSVTIRIKPSGGTARVIIDGQTLQDKNTRVTGGFTLEAGDSIRGDAGGAGAAAIDYIIMGAEEDLDG